MESPLVGRAVDCWLPCLVGPQLLGQTFLEALSFVKKSLEVEENLTYASLGNQPYLAAHSVQGNPQSLAGAHIVDFLLRIISISNSMGMKC